MKINFINSSYRRYFTAHKKEILTALTKCISEGNFIMRDDLAKFEKKLAGFVGTKYAVGVNSGTDALFLSLKALGIGPGDEVITVSHTFIATIQVIVHCGATPILIDVTGDGVMDVSKIEKAITPKTKAIIPVHLSGKTCDMKTITDLAIRFNLAVVEDACQALGSYCDIGYPVGTFKKAGSIGITGCFSFISPKTLGGISDGGAVVTDSKSIYEKLLLLRNHWNITQNALLGHQPKQPSVMDWGWNSRLGNVTAAFLNIKFKYYNQMLKRRAEITEMYEKGINNPLIEKPKYQDGQIWSEYIIRTDHPTAFRFYMNKKGIELLIRDLIPNHKLRGLGLEHFNLPMTEHLAKYQARLPIYPCLYNKEVKYIIKQVNRYK
jgi:dTDP-4-amino-4,6-dideoxygalactose transaminase